MAVTHRLVLLVMAVALGCVEGQEAYSKLPELVRHGVDLTLEHLHNHSATRQLLLFFKSLELSEVDVSFDVRHYYHNFYLRATRCSKGTANPDLSKCPFRMDRPLMDCVACYNTYNGNIEPDPVPYIHCSHKPSLKESIKRKRKEHCHSMNHFSGAGTLLAQKGL